MSGSNRYGADLGPGGKPQGGGKGGSGGGGGGGGEAGDDCLTFRKRASLNSADPRVVVTLRPGLRLDVRLDPAGTGKVEVVYTGPSGPVVAGSLTFSGVAALRRCLERGVAFAADVISVTGGDVVLDVRAAAA